MYPLLCDLDNLLLVLLPADLLPAIARATDFFRARLAACMCAIGTSTLTPARGAPDGRARKRETARDTGVGASDRRARLIEAAGAPANAEDDEEDADSRPRLAARARCGEGRSA